MPFRFSDFDSSPPSTPDRSSTARSPAFTHDADHPSTTPAGPPPPPSSAPSYTPAGDPSPSYLSSSIGVMSGKPKPPNFGRPNLRSSTKSSKSSPSKGSSAPLGRSLRSSTTRQPSGLSKEYLGETTEEDEPVNRAGTFSMPYDDSSEAGDSEIGDDEDAEGEDEEDIDEEEQDGYDDEDEEIDPEAMAEDDEYDAEEDLLREIAGADSDPDLPYDSESDLMMLTTPAADERIRRDVDNLLRVSHAHALKRDYKYAILAKDLFSHIGFADVSESDDVLLQTEELMNRLMEEAVGEEDDPDRRDDKLAQASDRLVRDIWKPYSESLPKDRDEHAAKVGPSTSAPDFDKALYVANLLLRIHHSPRIVDRFGTPSEQALPGVLFDWQKDEHDLDGDQISVILRHQPAPASHSLFWQAVYNALIRGDVTGAVRLLRNAGWGFMKKGSRGEALFSEQAVANIKKVVEDLCAVMDGCPAVSSDSWDIRSSDWTLFRLKAKAAKEALINFAEGKDRPHQPSNRLTESEFADSRRSLSGLARKAESQIPWEIYEDLQSLYAILIGDPEAILAAAQDWCEATLGLFGWWDDGHKSRAKGLAHSMSLQLPGPADGSMYYSDRLALSLQTATESDFHFNSADLVEVGVACAFEGNVEAVISFLRVWSLPVASTAAEIASLGRWLPDPEPPNLISMHEFDIEELEVLGMGKDDQGDQDGIKDTTLIQYARALRARGHIAGSTSHGFVSHEGWELAVQVVGRMDNAARSEQMVEELLRDVLETVNEGSRATVDKIWKLLNDLGMVNFAEDTAETFGDILAKDTFRFGDTLWFYALAHRPGKVRDVLNTLMSISLVESTTYPPESELDETLGGLLMDRTATLEQFAKQDLEAAELLGKMLSGYATLRKFYELRDSNGKANNSLPRRQQAAAALTAVIASADDNIRGGLYDDSRDAVVSEDFLLALLGEASVFAGQSPALITLEQMDTLLKAVEDIQTVGSRVYDAAEEFYKLVLASGQGKGSTPASLLSGSGPGLSGSFSMAGSSLMASQLHQSVTRSGLQKNRVRRAWDWRTSIYANAPAADVLRRLRLALTQDLANLWLEQADSIIL